MTQKLGPRQRKWIDALRSGEYRQAYGSLVRDSKFCCLGVACDVAKHDRDSGVSQVTDQCVLMSSGTALGKILCDEVANYLGLRSRSGDPGREYNGDKIKALVSLNDDFHLTFRQIADILESHPEYYFKELK